MQCCKKDFFVTSGKRCAQDVWLVRRAKFFQKGRRSRHGFHQCDNSIVLPSSRIDLVRSPFDVVFFGALLQRQLRVGPVSVFLKVTVLRRGFNNIISFNVCSYLVEST